MVKRFLLLFSVCLFVCRMAGFAQEDGATFKNFQFSFSRVTGAAARYTDSVKSMFAARGLNFPSKDIYIRSFKSNNEMELWARNSDTEEYRMVKLYRVCALSGKLGPKRIEGDLQVPEGLYFIDDYNPRSDFYLSMLVSYPNYSDMILGDKRKPGGDVYIHGGCVTVGCLPMTDDVIQELYVVCMNAKMAGENYVPIHIFPARFDRKGLNFLGRNFMGDTTRQRFWVNLKSGYDYFEEHHKILPVMYTPEGKYVF